MRLVHLLGLAVFSASAAANAAPITYTESAYTSGYFDGFHYVNALTTLTQATDTSTLQFYGGSASSELLYGTTAGIKTVTVAGIGTDSITNSEFGMLGEDHAIGSGFADGTYLAGFSDAFTAFSFATETPFPVAAELAYSLGPITGELYQGTDGYENTSHGYLQFTYNSADVTSTFTAVGPTRPTSIAVTPEPSSFLLLGTGLLGVAGVVRKRIA